MREFNESRTDFYIHLEDLKGYPEREHMFLPLVGEDEITVFVYRADNLSDEQKELLENLQNSFGIESKPHESVFESVFDQVKGWFK